MRPAMTLPTKGSTSSARRSMPVFSIIASNKRERAELAVQPRGRIQRQATCSAIGRRGATAARASRREELAFIRGAIRFRMPVRSCGRGKPGSQRERTPGQLDDPVEDEDTAED